MKLNLEIIRTYIPEIYTTKSYGIESRTLLFQRPYLYESGMELLSGNLYILHSRDLPKKQPVSGIGLICLGDRIPSAWTASDAQILSVSEEIGLLRLFNQVNSIYNRFDNWDAQLRMELEKETDFDIRRCLLLGSELLENPMSVCGQTLQTLFATNYRINVNGDFEFFIRDSPATMNSSNVEMIRLVCGLERSITVPFLSSINIPNQQSYCYNLYSMEYFVGCIDVTTYCHPFREIDFPLADYFFSYFQKAFFKHLRNNNQTQSPGAAALQKLLRHEQMNDEEKALFLLPTDQSWVFFKLREKRGKKYLPKDYMYGTLNALMPQNVYIAMYHKEIVGLIRLQGKDDPTLESFGSLIKRMDYYAGLSNRFHTAKQIDEYLLQAHYVVEHNSQQADEESLFYFQDFALDYLLHACTAEMSPKAIISRNLFDLVDYDQRKGTEYIKTLDLYLKNEMSITKTADALFIHRSSLLKRLEKLQRMLEDDLSSPDKRLYYRICLALLK